MVSFLGPEWNWQPTFFFLFFLNVGNMFCSIVMIARPSVTPKDVLLCPRGLQCVGEDEWVLDRRLGLSRISQTSLSTSLQSIPGVLHCTCLCQWRVSLCITIGMAEPWGRSSSDSWNNLWKKSLSTLDGYLWQIVLPVTLSWKEAFLPLVPFVIRPFHDPWLVAALRYFAQK